METPASFQLRRRLRIAATINVVTIRVEKIATGASSGTGCGLSWKVIDTSSADAVIVPEWLVLYTITLFASNRSTVS